MARSRVSSKDRRDLTGRIPSHVEGSHPEEVTVAVSAIRGWAVFCMGVWLAGTVCTAIVATQNFYTIDRLLQAQPNTAFTAVVDKLGYQETREVLRYLSSELNRLYFQYWNIAQLAIGILALWLAGKLPGSERARWGIVAML